MCHHLQQSYNAKMEGFMPCQCHVDRGSCHRGFGCELVIIGGQEAAPQVPRPHVRTEILSQTTPYPRFVCVFWVEAAGESAWRFVHESFTPARRFRSFTPGGG